MTISATEAAVNAIVARLTTALGANVSAVIAGWPENPTDLDLSDGRAPVISVTAGGEVRTDVARRSLGSVTAGSVTTHTYRDALLEFVAQVDVWCAYRVQLHDVVPLVEAALTRAPPRPPGYRLTSTDYYSRPVDCHIGPFRADLDGDSAKKGEWRGTWDVRVTTDLVTTTTHVPQTRVDLDVTIDAGTPTTFTVFEP